MKRLSLSLALLPLTAVLATATPLAEAGPPRAAVTATHDLPREHVAADATFVVHLDVEALRRTTIWSFVESQRGELGLDEAREELGFDPLDVLHSATAYGTGGEPDTVILVTSDAIDGLLARLEQEGELASFEHGGLRLRSIDDGVAYVSEHGLGQRLIVLGEDADTVLDAVAVVRGQRPSLADVGDSPLRIEPVVGAFLSVAASDALAGMQGFEPASQVLGLAQGVQFDLGEAGGSLFAHLALETGSVETARDVAETVQGLLALGRIAIRSSEDVPPGVQDLLYALAVRTRGGAVSVDFEYSVSGLVSLLEILADEER